MILFHAISRMELAPGDVVVSAVTYHDYVLVITEQGNVFKITDNGERY